MSIHAMVYDNWRTELNFYEIYSFMIFCIDFTYWVVSTLLSLNPKLWITHYHLHLQASTDASPNFLPLPLPSFAFALTLLLVQTTTQLPLISQTSCHTTDNNPTPPYYYFIYRVSLFCKLFGVIFVCVFEFVIYSVICYLLLLLLYEYLQAISNVAKDYLFKL